MLKLTEVQKRSIFKTLANKSQYQTGLEFGFEKYYDSNLKVVNAVNKIYKDVLEHPEKYAVTQEVIELVQKGMEDRKGTHVALKRESDEFSKLQEKDLVLSVKQKAWYALDLKLSKLLKNKKALDAASLSSLGTIAGISFDKGQIAKGEATEHIALKAKIDPNMTPAEAIAFMLNMRENQLKEEE